MYGSNSRVQSRINSSSSSSSSSQKKSSFKTILEMLVLISWFGLTGYVGFQLGYSSDPSSLSCEMGGSSTQLSPQFLREKIQEYSHSFNNNEDFNKEEPKEIIDEEPTEELKPDHIEDKEKDKEIESLLNLFNKKNTQTTSSSSSSTSSSSSITTSSDQCWDHLKKKRDSYNIDELQKLWECPRSQVPDWHNVDITDQIDLKQSRWNSVITVDPSKFYDKYLSQYPADTQSSQPALIFSHKPLNSLEEVDQICAIIDIAVIPNKPGSCISITESYQDLASYHMLHADKQVDGTFSVTSNNRIKNKNLPSDVHYEIHRNLLYYYFKYDEKLNEVLSSFPTSITKNTFIGIVLDTETDYLLFLNSLAHNSKHNSISTTSYYLFVTSSSLYNKITKNKITNSKNIFNLDFLREANFFSKNALLKEKLIKSIYNKRQENTEDVVQELTDQINLVKSIELSFLQVWLAFTVSNKKSKILWQNPGTLWYTTPTDLNKAIPSVETFWLFKGRKDVLNSPFYASFSFFSSFGVERPVHFFHEIIFHFDLILAWNSLDAVINYRLVENNSRYGLQSHILSPFLVFNTNLIRNDPVKIREVLNLSKQERPKVLAFSRSNEIEQDIIDVLKKAGLWYI